MKSRIVYREKDVLKISSMYEGLKELYCLRKLKGVPGITPQNDNYYSFDKQTTSLGMKKLTPLNLDHDIEKMLDEMIVVLAHLEENGIVHNDIKPDNIMYDSEESKFILIDFGNARIHPSDETFYNQATASPECRYKTNPELNGKADVYALAMSVILLKHGPRRSYFIEDDDWKIYDFSDKIKKLFEKMLKVDPEERWSARQLLNLEKNDPVPERGRNEQSLNEQSRNERSLYPKLEEMGCEKHVLSEATILFCEHFADVPSAYHFSYYFACVEYVNIIIGNSDKDFFDNIYSQIQTNFSEDIYGKNKKKVLLDRHWLLIEVFSKILTVGSRRGRKRMQADL